MEPTANGKRLWTVAFWLIAATALAGAGILLVAQNFLLWRRLDENRNQQSAGPLDGATAQRVAELRQAPDDQGRREASVALDGSGAARQVPEEAKAHHAEARKLFEAAETINDVGKAIDEYQAALAVAPWWPEANKDLGLALEAAQRHDEAIAALHSYLDAKPGGHDAAAIEEEIRKIEARRNKRFSMSLGIATRCQFKVPVLVADYWLYLDGRLLSAPPHPEVQQQYNLVGMGTDQGYQFWDKQGMAALVNRGGRISYVRKGAEVYTTQTFDVEPGKHTLEFLLLSKTGFPFAIASEELELKTGDSKGFWFNMPAGYVGETVPQPVMSPFDVQNTDWQAKFNDRQATVKRKIKNFADDAIVQALNEAIVGERLSPSDRPAFWVKLPMENGGKRELDARLIAALVQYIAGKYGVDETAMTWSPADSPADYKDSLARLRPLIRTHNQRIESLKEIQASVLR